MKVYPKFDIIPDPRDLRRIDLFTQVRKQRKKDGVWFLIPVKTHYEIQKVSAESYETIIKDFTDTCYRILQLYKLDNAEKIVDAERPWIVIAKRDSDQRNEKYRLKHFINSNIQVL